MNTVDYVSAHVQGDSDPRTLILHAGISHHHEVTQMNKTEAMNGAVLEAVQQFAERLLEKCETVGR